MLHWTDLPEAPDRSLEEQMWRIVAGARAEGPRIRDHGLRVGLVVAAAASVPLIASIAWGAAYVLGLGVH